MGPRIIAGRGAEKQECSLGGRPTYLHRGSRYQHGVWFCQALVYKTDFFLAHCVSKEGHIRLQDSTTFLAGWDLETAHLLVRQEDIPIRSHTKCLSFPSRIQSFKVLLELRTQDSVSTGQAENPEIQNKVLIEVFMSAENLETLTCSLGGLSWFSTFTKWYRSRRCLSALLLCRNALEEVLSTLPCILPVQAVLFHLEILGDPSQAVMVLLQSMHPMQFWHYPLCLRWIILASSWSFALFTKRIFAVRRKEKMDAGFRENDPINTQKNWSGGHVS